MVRLKREIMRIILGVQCDPQSPGDGDGNEVDDVAVRIWLRTRSKKVNLAE